MSSRWLCPDENLLDLLSVPYLPRLICYRHGDVAGAFQNTHTAALGARPESLHMLAFIDHVRGHFQFIYIGAFVMFGIGDGGLQYFAYDLRATLVAEIQDVQGTRHRQAADLVGDQAAFLRRD